MPSELQIEGHGMVTSLGHSFSTSCAGARAGLSRARQLDGVVATDPTTGAEEPVTGQYVFLSTHGYEGLGRLLRLGAAALQDLRGSTPQIRWENTAIVANFSNSFYVRAIERREVQAAGDTYADIAVGDTYAGYWQAKIENLFVQRISEILPWIAQVRLWRIFCDGTAGIAKSFDTAVQLLNSSDIEFVVIGGIDSLVDPVVVDSLYRLGMLKSPANPSGLVPGEAASFVCLSTDVARHSSATPHRLGGWFSTHESGTCFDDQATTGAALATCLSYTCNALSDYDNSPRLLGNCVNGDFYTSTDWGSALVRLDPDSPLRQAPSFYPAMHYGDLGAAAPICAASTSSWLLTRSSRFGNSTPVFAQGHDGARVSFYVRRQMN